MSPSPIKLTDPGEWLKTQQSKAPTDPGEWLKSNPSPSASPTLQDHLKNEGFLDSAWAALKGTVGGIKDMFTGEYSHQTGEMIRKYHELEKNGTPEERRQFAKEGLLQSIPFASTAYKMLNGNIGGGAGDLLGMAALPIAAEALPAAAGAAKTAARVVTDPEVIRKGVKILPKGGAVLDFADALKNAANPPVPEVPPPAAAPPAQPAPPSGFIPNPTSSTLDPGSTVPMPKPGTPMSRTIDAVRKENAAAMARLQAERAAREAAAKIPPEVIQELTRDSAPAAEVGANPPEVAPDAPKAMAAAAGTSSLAEQLKAMMQESGTLPKEEPVPFKPPEFSAETRIASARAARVIQFRDAIQKAEIPYEDAKAMGEEDWGAVAKHLGIEPPSKATVSQTLFELRKLEPEAPKPARTPAKPNPKPKPLKGKALNIAQQLKDSLERP